jgi:hypothetical protein
MDGKGLGCGSAILILAGFTWFANTIKELTTREETTPYRPTYSAPSPSPSPVKKTYTTKEGYYAAIDERSLDLMVKAIEQDDRVLLDKMYAAGAIYPVYPNQEVFLTGCHGLICSTITFRYKGKAEEHWTVTEAIAR